MDTMLDEQPSYAPLNNEEITELQNEVKAQAAIIKRLEDEVERTCEARDKAQAETTIYRNRNEELKDRLVRAELNVQWLRGYVARARVDDVVGEELVETGDVDGERTLVPKRKFEPLPADYHDGTRRDGESMSVSTTRPPPRRKHWVNY